MQFHVAGVHTYKLHIPDKPLFDEDGNALDGLCVESIRRILICCTVQPEDRRGVVKHELIHAWAFHGARPADEESRCLLDESIEAQLEFDLASQGGVAALEDMKPSPINLRLPDAPATKLCSRATDSPGVADRITCGCCEGVTMCGNVIHGIPEFHEASRSHQVDRWLRCEICGVLTVWREYCAAGGELTGKIVAVPRPRMLRGAEATAWLEIHRGALV